MKILLTILGIFVASSTLFATPSSPSKCQTKTRVVVIKKAKPVNRIWIRGHYKKTKRGKVWIKGHWKRI